jgi:hypothetical protein
MLLAVLSAIVSVEKRRGYLIDRNGRDPDGTVLGLCASPSENASHPDQDEARDANPPSMPHMILLLKRRHSD